MPFLSNSDAHSPSPLKIGREFTRVRLNTKTPKSVIQHICGGDIILNAGLFPEEGKYNRTACTRCYHQFTSDEAELISWRCPYDGGRIKMGVRDRALLHAAEGRSARPARPPYLHTIPLGEIVRKVIGASSPVTRKCLALYSELNKTLGTEISILMDIPVSDIGSVNEMVASLISDLRRGDVILHPGGGGKYGTFTLPSLCNDAGDT